MPRDLEPSQIESDFLLESLKESLRLDFRAANEFRPLSISFGADYGSAEILLGQTRVLCRITAAITRPREDRPFDGQFVVNTELSPFVGASSHHGGGGGSGGGQDPEELLISRTLERSVRRSRALDTESLCVVAGRQCWSVRADLHFLNNDGNLLDAACLALTAALRHFRRPDVQVTGEDIRVFSTRERVPVPLQMSHLPICLTFSFFQQTKDGKEHQQDGGDGRVVLVDASREEERLRSGELSITMNKNRELSQLNKAGGVAVTPDVLMTCLAIAFVKTQELTQSIEEAVEADLRGKEERFIGGEAESERVRGVDDRPSV